MARQIKEVYQRTQDNIVLSVSKAMQQAAEPPSPAQGWIKYSYRQGNISAVDELTVEAKSWLGHCQ
jgi:hypothetical protein